MIYPKTPKERCRGSAVIEFTLIFPVLIFLLLGTFDAGFFMSAMLSVENAARVAAMDTSWSSSKSGSSASACADVLNELSAMPNASSFSSSCSALPLQVTAVAVTGADGNAASSVSVTYQTLQLIPIPGLAGQLTITRVVQMRVLT